MPKKKRSEEMIQTAIRLPRTMIERLKAAGGERGMNEEVRQRLEESFAEPRMTVADQTTEQLLGMIEQIAWTIAVDGQWHQNSNSFQVFKAAIEALLSHYHPKEPATLTSGLMYGGPNESPTTVGKTLAATELRNLQKRSFASPARRGS